MRKSAPKKKPAKKASVVVPPDILGNQISNEVPEEKLELNLKDEVLEDEKPIEEVELIEESNEVSFYEKVTGQKPPEKSDDKTPDSNEPQIENMNKRLFFLGGIVFLLTVVVATIVGLFIFNSTGKSEHKVEEQIPITITPTEAVKVEIDKSKWTFTVLNGSGEAGKAKKTADAIESLGYTVDSTGNAKDSNYSGVTISFIKEIEQKSKEDIISDLKKEFQTVKEEEEPSQLSESSILLIIGK